MTPVEGGGGQDFAITYICSRIKDTSAGIAAPQITAAQAIAAAGLDVRTRHLKVWGESDLVVIEADLGVGPEVFAAWRLLGVESEEAFDTMLMVYVDAVTREVVRIEPGVAHADSVTGTVTGKATGGVGPPLSSTVTEQVLPDLIVSIVGEDSTTTDGDGHYELETASESVDVEAALDAGFWIVIDEAAGSTTPTIVEEDVNPPASGVNFVFNNESSTPSQQQTARTNAFLNVQKSNQFFAQHVPSWTASILPSLPELDVFVNLVNISTAQCIGTFGQAFPPKQPRPKLTFTREKTDVCNNIAYSTIITHEYGHYIRRYSDRADARWRL